MLRKFRQKRKGFTLVELMIVIAILGILAAIAIPEFNKYRVRGFTATTRSDTKNVHTAVQAWLAENLGGAPPVVNPPVLGPAGLAEYPPARVSTGVRIAVNSTGDVTGTHVSLTGAYVISADGAVTDTLGQ